MFSKNLELRSKENLKIELNLDKVLDEYEVLHTFYTSTHEPPLLLTLLQRPVKFSQYTKVVFGKRCVRRWGQTLNGHGGRCV
jgi:hypothetical protein